MVLGYFWFWKHDLVRRFFRENVFFNVKYFFINTFFGENFFSDIFLRVESVNRRVRLNRRPLSKNILNGLVDICLTKKYFANIFRRGSFLQVTLAKNIF